MCILGWQRSLAMQLCTSLPFDYIQRAELRLVLMPTLISILYNNLPGVNVIRNEFDLTWLITYLKVVSHYNLVASQKCNLYVPTILKTIFLFRLWDVVNLRVTLYIILLRLIYLHCSVCFVCFCSFHDINMAVQERMLQ